MRPWRLSLLMACCGVTAGLASGLAAGGEVPRAEAPPIQFRWIYAPADRIQDWPRPKVPYVPVTREELERLIGAAAADRPDDPTILATAVVDATYTATLKDDSLLIGTARLQVLHEGAKPTLLRLGSPGLAARDPRWAGDPPRQALLGSAPDGAVTVVVPRSGQLEFDWSLAGSSQSAGAVRFAFDLPPSASNRLLVDLPETLAVRSSRGLVVGEPGPSAAESLRRWRVELGGHHRFALAVVPAVQLEHPEMSARVRQRTVYDCGLDGIHLLTELELDVLHEPLRELVVSLSPATQLVSVQLADQELRWEVSTASTAEGTRVVVSLPEPLAGVGRFVRLEAFSPLVIGQPVQLPRLRLEGVFWQEGLISLRVPGSLVLEQLRPARARPVKITTQRGAAPGTEIQLQQFSADAAVEVLFERPESQPVVDSGIVVTLDGDQTVARQTVVFQVDDHERFVVAGEVAPGWEVDSVEATSADARQSDVLGDWRVAARNGRRGLVVHLASSLAPARPVRLVVWARFTQPVLGRELSVKELVPIRFPRVTGRRRLMALTAAKSFETRLAGHQGLQLMAFGSLDEPDRKLLAEAEGALIFRWGAGAGKLRVQLTRREPSYRAKVLIQLTVGQRSVSETYRIHCDPESLPVGHVQVRFSPPVPGALRWTLEGQPQSELRVEPVGGGRQLGVGREAAEPQPPGLWEIRLPEPTSKPFQIVASRSVKRQARQALTLVDVPGANAVEGSVEIVARSTVALGVQTDRLEAVSTPGRDTPTAGPWVRRYRYDPATDVRFADAPAAVLVFGLPQSVPQAWVWEARLESRHHPNGRTEAWARYRLENGGRARIRFTWPREASVEAVHGVWVDGVRAAWREEAARQSGRLVVSLPARAGRMRLTIAFSVKGRPLGMLGSVRCLLPVPDVPVLRRQWLACIPPGFVCPGVAIPETPRQRPRLSLWQRTVGILGRPADAPVFDPADVDAWQRLISLGGPTRATADARQLLSRVEEAVAARAQTQGDPGLSWREVWSSPPIRQWLSGKPSGGGPVLLVDRWALAELGLGPQTPVLIGQSVDRASQTDHLFRRAGLAILVHPSALVLTSVVETAVAHKVLSSNGDGISWRVRPGLLAEEIQRAAERRRSDRFVPLAAWLASPINPEWVRAGIDLSTGPLPPGWTARSLPLGARSGPVRITVVRSEVLRGSAWAMFMISLAVGWFCGRRRPAVLAGATGTAAIAGLLVPQPLVPMASAACCGLLGAIAFALMARRRQPGGPRLGYAEGRARLNPSAAALGVLALAVALGLLLGSARGAEPAEQSAAEEAEAKIFDIFVPVDAERKPAGDQVYVPQALFEQLLRRSSEQRREPPGWLILSSKYSGQLAREPMDGRIELRELTVSFVVETFSPDSDVAIPFGATELDWPPGQVYLDGQETRAVWDNATGEIEFPVAEPGTHRVEIRVEPPPSGHGGDVSGFDLPIPAVIDSRLDFKVPPGVVLEVASAVGRPEVSADRTRWTAVLGPQEVLSVRWGEPGHLAPGGPRVEAEVLLLMKLQPAVVLQARVKVKPLSGPVGRLRLALDPRLRPQPVGDSGMTVRRLPDHGGSLQTVELVLDKPVVDQGVVQLTLLWTGSSGIGNLRPPFVDVLEARVTRRWLALWADPTLSTPTIVGECEKVDLERFADAWGPMELQAQWAVNLESPEPPWHLVVEPRRLRVSSAETLLVSFGLGEAEVRFDATLTVRSGHAFQYELTVPRQLEIERLSVDEGDVDRLNHWSRDETGTVHLFLNHPTAGDHRLLLMGRARMPLGKSVALPQIRIAGVELTRRTIGLFRQPAVDVVVEQQAGLTEAEPIQTDQLGEPWRRAIKWFAADPRGDIGARLTVLPNHPKARVVQRTSLDRKGGAWVAQVDFDVVVKQGVIDQFVLNPPPEWAGPYTISPGSALSVASEGPDRRLVVRPNSALSRRSGEFRFSVTGPLAFEAGESPHLPEIVLQGFGIERHVVVLPRQVDGKPARWDVEGLELDSTASRSPDQSADTATLVFAATRDRPQASLRRTDARPMVMLADYHMAWQPDRTCYGVAVFDLVHPGREKCRVRMPRGWQVLCAELNGRPAAIEPAGEGIWGVSLRPANGAGRLSLVFTGRQPLIGSGTAWTFDAPWIEDLPVRQTAWTVVGPPALSFRPAGGQGACDELDQALARLRSLKGLATAVDKTDFRWPRQTAAWYRWWLGQWRAAWKGARGLMAFGSPERRRLAIRQLNGLAETDKQLAEKLGLAAGAESQVAVPPERWECLQDWLSGAGGPDRIVRVLRTDGRAPLEVSVDPADAGQWTRRMFAALLVAAASLLAVVGVSNGLWLRVLHRWPHGIGVAVGLGWWLWLQPSWLGLAMVVLILISLLRPAWRSPRGHGSAVITVSYARR
ncbi:MAG TPA: hypothetical protein EYH34_15320 [Planctomycetes bacterium]|nr:hypothetical protein [Planctomycetota bacterium]